MLCIRPTHILRMPLRNPHRLIAHLSPLADVFNNLNTKNHSVKQSLTETGLFGIDILNSPHGFEKSVSKVRTVCSELLDEALSPNRTRKMVKILDDISDSLCRVADLADCVRFLHPDLSFREHASAACEAIGGLVEELNTNPDLYAAAVRASGPHCPLPDRQMDCVDKRVLDLLIADFELSGVQLKDPIRQTEFVRAANEALRLGADFAQASHTPVSFLWTDPHSSIGHQMNLLQPIVDTPDAQLREASYRAFYGPIPGQEERLVKLLDSRHRMACAAGFNRFTERATLHSLASTTENITTFLESICKRLAPQASRTALEYLVPVICANHVGQVKCVRLEPWDVGFALGARRQLIQIDELAKYFSLGACMEGVSQLAECLFGLRLRVEPVRSGETWHSTVIKVGVYSESDQLVGLVYCDLLDRPGKPAQDCHYTIRGGRCLENDQYQRPIITLQLTLDPPSAVGVPPLLSPGQVENLFHEWGHALHSMLARTRYQHVTGTRCSTDLAEIPSTLFEHFALDPRVTREYARHWRFGTLPSKQELEALERLAVGSHLGCSVEAIQQTTYALLDQVLHSGPPDITLGHQSQSDTLPASCHLLSSTQTESGLSDWLVCDADHLLAWPHRFTHLVGYAGRYYAYLMARAGAELIWQHCFARDPWSSSSGKVYANEVLRHGGEFSPILMLTNLLTSHDCGTTGSGYYEKTLSCEQLANSLVAQLEENEHGAARLFLQLSSPGLHQPRVKY